MTDHDSTCDIANKYEAIVQTLHPNEGKNIILVGIFWGHN